MVGRWTSILIASGAALASVAAAPEEKERLLEAIDAVLTGMAYAGVGLCLFAIVWAGFLLMAEGAEGDGRRGKRGTPWSWPSSAWWWCSWQRPSHWWLAAA